MFFEKRRGDIILESKQLDVKESQTPKPNPSERLTMINAISTEDNHVDLLCRVRTYNTKGFIKNGLKLNRFFGLLEDSSGTISFTAWRPLGLEPNDVVKIKHARVRQWQGVTKININSNTEVKKVEDENLLNEFKSIKSLPISRKVKIKFLQPDFNNISCTCRVVSIEPLEIKLNDEVTTVFKGVLADDTGSIRFTAWKDFELDADRLIEIQFASVKIWRGFLELNLHTRTKVIRDPESTLPKLEELPIEKRIPIDTLYEDEYVTTPEFVLKGTIIEFKEGSGVIRRCPKCLRAVSGEVCIIHGKIESKHDLRLKAVLDDGTGAVTVFIGREITEKLIDQTLEDCLQIISNSDDETAANENIVMPLQGYDIEVKGDILRDEFRISVIAKEVTKIRPDSNTIQSEAEALLEVLE